jgi:hypothetical protein
MDAVSYTIGGMDNTSSNPALNFYIQTVREIYPCATYPKGGYFTDNNPPAYETREQAERVAKMLSGLEVKNPLDGNPYRIASARVLPA